MKLKKQYEVPTVAEYMMKAEVTLVAGAPSARTDTGDQFEKGGDDEEGLEGDAKEYWFDLWEEEE